MRLRESTISPSLTSNDIPSLLGQKPGRKVYLCHFNTESAMFDPSKVILQCKSPTIWDVIYEGSKLGNIWKHPLKGMGYCGQVGCQGYMEAATKKEILSLVVKAYIGQT